jgi:hypothetical protein
MFQDFDEKNSLFFGGFLDKEYVFATPFSENFALPWKKSAYTHGYCILNILFWIEPTLKSRQALC